MSEQSRELAAPENMSEDALEILRVWVTDAEQEVSIRTEVWDDPAVWGIFLYDLVRHVARAYAQTTSRTEEQARDRILEGFSAEISSPTDTPTGDVS
jgi:hypothetical protein